MISARVLSVLVNALVLASLWSPGTEERKGVYEENDDVDDMIGKLSRPFLFLCYGMIAEIGWTSFFPGVC